MIVAFPPYGLSKLGDNSLRIQFVSNGQKRKQNESESIGFQWPTQINAKRVNYTFYLL